MNYPYDQFGKRQKLKEGILGISLNYNHMSAGFVLIVFILEGKSYSAADQRNQPFIFNECIVPYCDLVYRYN